MRKHITALALAVFGLFALVTLASAKNATISIPIESVDVHTGERGAFYVVTVSVPGDITGKRLDTVLLEFAVEATPLSLEDSVVSPAVGAFPLSEAFVSGGANGEPVFESRVPSVRPIHLGENRVLKLDITDIVKAWMDAPETNHGLVIGALTGPEVGVVVLKNALPDSDSAIRITFFYQDRHGEAISSRE